MPKIIIINIIQFLFLFVLVKPVCAVMISEQSAQLSSLINNTTKLVTDKRKDKLAAYLKYKNSPLVPFAALFVDKADEYQIDWRLLPAITGVESAFGKANASLYNAYGWGNGTISFASWEDSIDVVSKALKEKYIDRGLNSVEKIAPVYAPPSITWAAKVNYFMEEIALFLPRRFNQLDLSL